MTRLPCGLLIVATMMVGCSDPAAKFKENPVTVVTWGALETLFSEDVMRPVVMPAEMEDWAGVKAGAATAEFKAAVEEFASTEIPGEFASADRKTAKEEAVKHYRALIEAAEKNAPADEIKAAYEAAAKNMLEVRKPDAPQAD